MVSSFLVAVPVAWITERFATISTTVKLLARVGQQMLHQVSLGLGGMAALGALPHLHTVHRALKEQILLQGQV